MFLSHPEEQNSKALFAERRLGAQLCCSRAREVLAACPSQVPARLFLSTLAGSVACAVLSACFQPQASLLPAPRALSEQPSPQAAVLSPAAQEPSTLNRNYTTLFLSCLKGNQEKEKRSGPTL